MRPPQPSDERAASKRSPPTGSKHTVEIGKAIGARVIAAASTPEKLRVAADRSADALINYSTEKLTHRVMALTDGKGADAGPR
jgi:NADPH:quinone reductase-like Zn-dependent oxidoreductase